MSEATLKYRKSKKPPEKKGNLSESKALANLRSEAKKSGATLATNGEGGLPSSSVLGVMRRDEYRCKRCGKNAELSVHHKGHLKNPASRWLAKKGSENSDSNLVTICAGCHDKIHQEDNTKS